MTSAIRGLSSLSYLLKVLWLCCLMLHHWVLCNICYRFSRRISEVSIFGMGVWIEIIFKVAPAHVSRQPLSCSWLSPPKGLQRLFVSTFLSSSAIMHNLCRRDLNYIQRSARAKRWHHTDDIVFQEIPLTLSLKAYRQPQRAYRQGVAHCSRPAHEGPTTLAKVLKTIL